MVVPSSLRGRGSHRPNAGAAIPDIRMGVRYTFAEAYRPRGTFPGAGAFLFVARFLALCVVLSLSNSAGAQCVGTAMGPTVPIPIPGTWVANSVPPNQTIQLNINSTAGLATATVTGCNAALVGAVVSGPNFPRGDHCAFHGVRYGDLQQRSHRNGVGHAHLHTSGLRSPQPSINGRCAGWSFLFGLPFYVHIIGVREPVLHVLRMPGQPVHDQPLWKRLQCGLQLEHDHHRLPRTTRWELRGRF